MRLVDTFIRFPGTLEPLMLMNPQTPNPKLKGVDRVVQALRTPDDRFYCHSGIEREFRVTQGGSLSSMPWRQMAIHVFVWLGRLVLQIEQWGGQDEHRKDPCLWYQDSSPALVC